MMNVLFVGLGGAIGAILRYVIGLLPYKSDFPILTLFINLVGAVVIGFITGLAVKKNISEHAMLFFKTGLCGGFTTFSTFSLEAYTLFKNGSVLLAILYIILSIALCLIGIVLGMSIAKRM